MSVKNQLTASAKSFYECKTEKQIVKTIKKKPQLTASSKQASFNGSKTENTSSKQCLSLKNSYIFYIVHGM